MKTGALLVLLWLAGFGSGFSIKAIQDADEPELPPEPEVITLYIERCSDPEVEDESHIDELYSAHEHYRRM